MKEVPVPPDNELAPIVQLPIVPDVEVMAPAAETLNCPVPNPIPSVPT